MNCIIISFIINYSLINYLLQKKFFFSKFYTNCFYFSCYYYSRNIFKIFMALFFSKKNNLNKNVLWINYNDQLKHKRTLLTNRSSESDTKI